MTNNTFPHTPHTNLQQTLFWSLLECSTSIALLHVYRNVALLELLLYFSLFLTWLLDSTWSLHVFLHCQSTECWQNLQNNSSPDTYKSFENCSALYWGVNYEFLEDRTVGSRFTMLTGAQSVEGASCATQICFPLCSFPLTYVPLPHENSISVNVCQIAHYKIDSSNWPIPQNHRALPELPGAANGPQRHAMLSSHLWRCSQQHIFYLMNTGMIDFFFLWLTL